MQTKPIRVIHTKGNNREIGEQHGELLKEDISNGMCRFYLEFWNRMIQNKTEGLMDGIFLELGKLLLDPLLVKRLKKNIPVWGVDRIKGISKASGYTVDELLSTLILPDLMPILQSYLGYIRPSALIEASKPPRFGCTSFFAKDKNLYQGRNLDFPGVNYWDRFPVIQLIELPDKLKYIGFTTAGVPIAGITGINEAHIMVSLHQHYSRATSLSGSLPFVIAEKILSEATTLEEAKEILEKENVASSWAFVIGDGKTKTGFLEECDAKGKELVDYEDREEVFAHSNAFQTKECQRREYATTARMNWDNYSRRNRLQQLLSLQNGNYTPEKLVQIVSDHYDPFWQEEKVMNRTVSQVYNIQSLVVNLTEMKAYMAEGGSPIHLGEYHEFDLGQIFARKEGRTGVKFPGYRFKNQQKEQAKKEYILSFISAFDGDFQKAQTGIEKSLVAEFNPEAALVYSILQLKNGNYPRALESLSQAKSFIESKKRRLGKTIFPPEYFEICLFLGRTMDLMERRNEALMEYRTLSSHADLEDANVRKLANSRKPYSRKQLSKIIMPYSTYIPFE